MKKLSTFLIGSAMALAVSSVAVAGQKLIAPVSVSYDYASGAVGTARNSTDSNQYINCALYSWGNPSSASVICSARNATGNSVYCSAEISHSAAIVQAAMSITPSSYIAFYVEAGDCVRLDVVNGSQYEVAR
jgi:hypothetical protein